MSSQYTHSRGPFHLQGLEMLYLNENTMTVTIPIFALFFIAGACVLGYMGYKIREDKRRQVLEHFLEQGLNTDGAHHKQYYLEKISAFLGIRVEYNDRGTAP